MITAEVLLENAVAALRGGADDFIGKPINLEELRFALDKALKLKRLGREPEAVNRPHILIISDSAERIPHLQAGFDSQEVEIASAVFPEEWEYISGDKHDLAGDVSPALLEPLLGNLAPARNMRRFLRWWNRAGSRRRRWRACCRNIARCHAATMS